VLEATDRRTGKPYEVTDFDVINFADEGTAMLQDAVFARASWLSGQGHEATAIGNVLVQARARGLLAGDLESLRGLIRATQEIRRFEPGRTTARSGS